MSQAATTQEASAVREAALGQRTARGFAWMVSQTVIAKALTTLGTLALGKLLLDDDFGLAALAYAYSVIPSLVQQGGLREILVQRHGQFRRWANPAFWMSSAQGLAAGLMMAALAPVGAAFAGTTFAGLLIVIAVAFPLDALSIVPQARLQNQMRFRFLAALELIKALGQTGLSLAFAKMGMGAYSLLLPRPIVSTMAAAICWCAAPAPLRRHPQIRRWRFLFGDSGMVFAGNSCSLIILYADYFILSQFRDKGAVGQYYFAFSLSLQTIMLITQNLGGVLFPALARLQREPVRQVEGFLRATRLMAFITLPACLGQAALAEPALRLVYGHKWDEAIPLLQALSIGMAARTVGWPAVTLLNAQGRFAARMWLSIASLLLFIAMVTIGASRNGALGTAVAVSIHMLILEPVQLLMAIRRAHVSALAAARLLAGPALVALASVGPAWLAGELLPEMNHRDWWRAAAVVGISGLAYFPLLHLIAPEAWRETRERLLPASGR